MNVRDQFHAIMDGAPADGMPVLDWANSPEGFITVAMGVQGIDYDIYDFESRIVTGTQDQIDNPANNVSGYMNFANAYNDEPATYASKPEDAALIKKIYEEFDNAVEQINVPCY